MTKRIIGGILTVLLAVGLLAGCGKEKEEELSLAQMDVDQYVNLGDYMNLGVSIASAKVDEEELEQLMLGIYSQFITAEAGGITDRAVELGDTVNIDYTGKQDGVAFAGGTAAGALLNIGSGEFIDGFEDGLIGVMPGETVDLEISFPDPYLPNPDLSGQPVVFTVTVNFILPVVESVEDMLDVVIPQMGIEGVETVEELRQYAYDYLYEMAQADYMADLQNAIIKALIEQSEFLSIPETMLEESKETLAENLDDLAAQMGVTAEVLLNAYYNGMTVEEFLETYAPEGVKQNLAFQAIANREGLTVDDDELRSLLEEYAYGSGYTSVEEFMEGIPVEEFRNYFMSEKVINFLMEKVQENL